MTRPVVGWTDDEILKAHAEADRKCDRGSANRWAFLHAFLSALPAISEADAREREREAFDAGADWHGRNWAFPVPKDRGRGKEELYPSLLPPTPPPLVLSGRRWVRASVSGWVMREEGDDNPVAMHGNSMPLLDCASDAEKLAAWLRAYGSEQEAK